jgi:ubiquinone biosynthesis UbiH/UbiF/VisC/COQ6 family hydroxylase
VSDQVDVAVVGGGMAGATLARALRREGLSVALVERNAAPEPGATAGDPERVSAINAGSREILTDLGLWEAIAGAGAAPIETIEVTDGTRSGRTVLDRQEADESALGHVVPNRVIVMAAWERLRADDGVRLCPGTGVVDLHRGESVRLTLDTEGEHQTLDAAMVVGADGEHSAIRRSAGIDTWGWHHNRYGLVATVTAERDLDGWAFERFLPEGPLAFLPLGGRQASIVWTTGPGAAAELEAETDTAFLARLQERFGPALGRLEAVGRRASYPLELRVAKRFTAPRAALVGNAGHLVHPVGGQGFNLGLRDVHALAEEAGRARRQGWDPGHHQVLARYERRRRADTAGTVAFTEGLTRLFATGDPALAGLRQAGLRLMDRVAPLRRTLMNQAMGKAGGGLPGLLPRRGR